MSNCPNCGAPIDITVDKCAYCDTYYSTNQQQSSTYDVRDIMAAVNAGFITVNEARRRMRIEVVEDFEFATKPIPIEWSN